MLHETHNLAGYLEGSLPEGSHERVTMHLERCAHCRAALTTLKAAGRALEAAGRSAPAPAFDAELWSRVRSQISSPHRQPSFRPRWALVGGGGALVTAGIAIVLVLSQPDAIAPPPAKPTITRAPQTAAASGSPKVLAEAPKQRSRIAAQPPVDLTPKGSKAYWSSKEVHPSGPPVEPPAGHTAPPAATPAQPTDRNPGGARSTLLAAAPTYKAPEAELGYRRLNPAPSAAGAYAYDNANAAAPVGSVGGTAATSMADANSGPTLGVPAAAPAPRPAGTAKDEQRGAATRRAEEKTSAAVEVAVAGPLNKIQSPPAPAIVATEPPPAPKVTLFADSLRLSGQEANRTPKPAPKLMAARRLIARADLALANGDTAGARKTYQRVLDNKPIPSEARDAHIGLGDAAVKAKDDAAAIKEYRAAADIARDADLMVKLGKAYERAGKLPEARDAFKTALGLSASCVEAKEGLQRTAE
ncbi:MAG TPA: tetratricopeptide repeat protein [Armatimonadota bacterium]|jgi:tetratricopeptide (TPR) repeat protein